MHRNCFFVAIVLMTLLVTIPGCALRPNYTIKFDTEDGGTNFVVHFAPRVPKAFGGEENVYVQRVTPVGKSRKYKIDHNGRFSRRIKVDSGNNGKWARVYLDESDRPMVGESVPFRTNEVGEISWLFKDFHTGQTSVSNVYVYTVIAFIDFESRRAINGYQFNSSMEERNNRLFGLVDSFPTTQTLRGETIVWKSTKRLALEK